MQGSDFTERNVAINPGEKKTTHDYAGTSSGRNITQNLFWCGPGQPRRIIGKNAVGCTGISDQLILNIHFIPLDL